MTKVRYFGLSVYLAVLGGVLVSLCPVSETKAQDRPAVARPGKKKAAKESEPAKLSKEADNGSAEATVVEPGPSVNIGKILPEGRVLRGVKLPSYTGDRLSSLMTAVTMKRLDEKHLDMEELRITMYAKPGEAETLISTERGIYDLEKEEITSDTRTLIAQEGVFDLEGDTMVFDANTQKGKMTGNVKMLFYHARENLMMENDVTDHATDQGKAKEEDGK